MHRRIQIQFSNIFTPFSVADKIKDIILEEKEKTGKEVELSKKNVIENLKSQNFTKDKLVETYKGQISLKISQTKDDMFQKILATLIPTSLSSNELDEEPKQKKQKLSSTNPSDTALQLGSVSFPPQESEPNSSNLRETQEPTFLSRDVENESCDKESEQKVSNLREPQESATLARDIENESGTESALVDQVTHVELNQNKNNGRNLQNNLSESVSSKQKKNKTTSTILLHDENNEDLLTYDFERLCDPFPMLRNFRKDYSINANLMSVDVDTSLAIVGLLIKREKNLNDILKNITTDWEKQDSRQICNPVYFGPSVNHHTVQHAGLQKEFLDKVYDNIGEYSITDNNKIQVLLFELGKYRDSGSLKESECYCLESLFATDYILKSGEKDTKIVKHTINTARPINLHGDQSVKERISQIFKFISHFEYVKISSVNDLHELAKKMNISLSKDFQSNCEDVKFRATYEELATKIQHKFQISIGIPEGLHRLVVSIRALYGDYLTNLYHYTLPPGTEARKLSFASPVFEMSNFRILIPFQTFPRLDSLKAFSSNIRKGQNLGHNKSLTDQLFHCLNSYESALNQHSNSHHSRYKHSHWYSYKKPDILKDKARKEIKLLTRKMKGEQKKSALDIYATEQDEILKERMKTYCQYNEYQDPHTFTASLALPTCYPYIKQYFLFNQRFQLREKEICKINDEDTQFKLFKFAQLSDHKKSIVMKTEYSKTTNSGELKSIHFNVRMILQFLRYMLMFETNRHLLRLYATKSDSCIEWETSKNNQTHFFSTDIYEFEFLQKIMETSTKNATSLTEYLESRFTKCRAALNKTKIFSIFLEGQLRSILSAVLKIGKEPLVDQALLQQKIGDENMKLYFESESRKCRIQFLSVMLDFYLRHIQLVCQVQNVQKIKYFSNIHDYIMKKRNKKKNTALESIGGNIKAEDFLPIDFQNTIDTRNCGKGYRFDKGVVIPGSFHNFCLALASPSEKSKKNYEKFTIIPYADSVDTSKEHSDSENSFQIQSSSEEENNRAELVQRRKDNVPTTGTATNEPIRIDPLFESAEDLNETNMTSTTTKLQYSNNNERETDTQSISESFDRLLATITQKNEELTFESYFTTTFDVLQEKTDNKEMQQKLQLFQHKFVSYFLAGLPEEIKQVKLKWNALPDPNLTEQIPPEQTTLHK